MGTSGKMETAANLATIVVSILLSAVLVKVFLLPPSAPRRGPAYAQVESGWNFKARLPGVDWQKNGRTLVLAISTKCHFCTDSAPFFRRLATETGKDVKIVAVLPQPVAEGEQYLVAEGVRADQVLQAAPDKIGVRGTPTMILVNASGVVSQVWVGKLEPAQQEMVLSVLKGQVPGIASARLPQGPASGP
ncbi:MAG TPA: hypothetical protein VGW37_16360 [Terriglobia bacterium]|nr:hypothetical protein [Terriglobia bacterium]